MRYKHLIFSLTIVLTIFSISCNRKIVEQQPGTASNHILLHWNTAAFEAMGGKTYQHSLMAARINAMVHIAMHDAINAIHPKFEQYVYRKSKPGGDIEVAAAYAAHTVLLASFPDKKNMLDSVLTASLSNKKDEEQKSMGMTVGLEAGRAVIADRAGDGAEINPIVPVKPTTTPGEYNVVPPFDFVFAPHWKKMKLFGLQAHDQFRPAPPPSLNSDVYKEGFEEVKKYGSLNSAVRSADQTFYAKFWYEFSEIGWNRVARTVAADKKVEFNRKCTFVCATEYGHG